MVQQVGEDESSTGTVNLKESHPSIKDDGRLQPTTDWMAIKSPVISIAVIDEHSFTRECIARSLQEFDHKLDIASFAACDDCLKSTRTHDLVLYHAHESATHRDIFHHRCESAAHHEDDQERLAHLKRLLKIAPVIILSAVECPESIVEAFESGARGYIPMASTSVELAVEIIRLVRAGGTFVPPSTLSLRETDWRGSAPRVITIHRLTPRQIEVLDYLKLGKTNKIIAHELEMSESTVKVHIRNIMKKMKATNRTEVACLAYDLATDHGAKRVREIIPGSDWFG
jgi:DNA-binding NarL/FixJ family response regulator